GYKFRRQHSIGKYIVDFYCPKKRLIIELDGSQHIDNKQHDKERDNYLSNFNYSVLRFYNSDINNNIEGVVLKIKDFLN
ncbi:MAG: endonuclease domain-containing protein, partial [Parcubacteria group bacterium]|nr:endonuclease domain-containing protein [Parcubacteria group bacterium]